MLIFILFDNLNSSGISKSFRRVASGLSIKMKKGSDESDADVELRLKNNLAVKTPAAQRR